MISSYYHQWKNQTTVQAHLIPHSADAKMATIFFLCKHQAKYPQKKLADFLADDVNPYDLFDQLVFKKVKKKALIALQHWINLEWPFILTDRILSPYEILAYQAQGIRPVSMILQTEQTPILHKDDALEFFLHDLEHGFQFFYDLELQEMQKLFFKNVFTSLKTDLWKPYLASPKFKKDFYYLISDMNTHLEHYRYFLKAIIPPQDFSHFEQLFKPSFQ
jgi:hypothetical protein